jgi:ERCC4-related helicase
LSPSSLEQFHLHQGLTESEMPLFNPLECDEEGEDICLICYEASANGAMLVLECCREHVHARCFMNNPNCPTCNPSAAYSESKQDYGKVPSGSQNTVEQLSKQGPQTEENKVSSEPKEIEARGAEHNVNHAPQNIDNRSVTGKEVVALIDKVLVDDMSSVTTSIASQQLSEMDIFTESGHRNNGSAGIADRATGSVYRLEQEETIRDMKSCALYEREEEESYYEHDPELYDLVRNTGRMPPVSESASNFEESMGEARVDRVANPDEDSGRKEEALGVHEGVCESPELIPLDELPLPKVPEALPSEVCKSEFGETSDRLVLRDYQQEVVDEIGESNGIALLPTGTGKTAIAAAIIKRRMNTYGIERGEIALFLAPTTALVEQQADKLKEWTCLRVATLKGKRKTPSESNFDILVATPSRFSDYQGVSGCSVDWSNICICVFDEVHHAVNRHPYRDLAKDIQQNDACETIQIIGLTASLTYQVKDEKIAKSIQQLKATMGAEKIVSPALIEGLREVDFFVDSEASTVDEQGAYNPDLLHQSFLARMDKREGSALAKCMYDILEDMKNEAQLLFPKFRSPLTTGTWMDWQSYALECAGEKEGPEQHSFFLFKLAVWYVALGFFVSGKVEEEELALMWLHLESGLTGLRHFPGELVSKIDKVRSFLEQPDYINTFLRLRKYLREKSIGTLEQSGQCIIFVEKRITAYIVNRFLSECMKLSCADYVTRPSKITASLDMKEEQQADAIKNFRNGECSVIVATAVIEEGLDVPSVMYIVFFDYIVTTVQLCQRAGRARKHKAEVYILRERQDRTIKHLKESIVKQNRVIESIHQRQGPSSIQDMSDPGVDCVAEHSREGNAYRKFFVGNEDDIEDYPTKVFNEFKTRVKGKLTETEKIEDGKFLYHLEFRFKTRDTVLCGSGSAKQKKQAKALAAKDLIRSIIVLMKRLHGDA